MRKSILLILIVILVIFFTGAGGLIMYLVFFEDLGSSIEGRSGGVNLKNPVEGLNDEEAIAKFDESFVYFLLVSIKAYNLHKPVFSSDIPRIELRIGEKVFNSVIDDGEIIVKSGEIDNEDVVFVTPTLEAVKMVRDKSYIEKSFESGKSRIELIAGKTTLASKGYLKLYLELTGKSITGKLVKLYF